MTIKKSNKNQISNLYDEDEKPTFTFPPTIENKKINNLSSKDDEEDESSSSSDEEDIKYTKKAIIGGAVEDDEEEIDDSETDVDDDDDKEDEDEDEDEEQEEGELDNDEESEKVKSKSKKSSTSSGVKVKSKKIKPVAEIPTFLDEDLEEDEDDDDYEDDDYLQKFERDTNDEYLIKFHPESKINNYDEVQTLATVVRDSYGRVVDPLHKTIPIMTKYEKARIIGIRAKQLNNGAKCFLTNIPNEIIDGYILAGMELEQKLIPFIIRRPLPNGNSEYWRVSDLQLIL